MCAAHVDSPTAKQLLEADIAENADDPQLCYICDDATTPGGSLDDLVELMLKRSTWLYEPYGTSEAAGAPELHDRYTADAVDMVSDLLGTTDPGGKLCQDVAAALRTDTWISVDWRDVDLQGRLAAPWDEFGIALKHGARFTINEYLADREPHLHGVVTDVLTRLADTRLRVALPAGTALFRARMHESKEAEFTVVKELLPPPADKAAAGRMNPAGITLFYCALDEETALAEVYSHASTRTYAVAGQFICDQDLRLLDLTGRWPVDLLSVDHGAVEEAVFLNKFIDSVSRPVYADSDPHSLDYLPTQYLVEVIERSTGAHTGATIDVDGIMYPSQAHPEGSNVVLFPDRIELPSRWTGEIATGATLPALSLSSTRWHTADTRARWRWSDPVVPTVPAPAVS